MPGPHAGRPGTKPCVRRLPTPNVKAALSPHGFRACRRARRPEQGRTTLKPLARRLLCGLGHGPKHWASWAACGAPRSDSGSGRRPPPRTSGSAQKATAGGHPLSATCRATCRDRLTVGGQIRLRLGVRRGALHELSGRAVQRGPGRGTKAKTDACIAVTPPGGCAGVPRAVCRAGPRSLRAA